MAELTLQEFVTEQIIALEERMEIGFSDAEEKELRRLLESAVYREETGQ